MTDQEFRELYIQPALEFDVTPLKDSRIESKRIALAAGIHGQLESSGIMDTLRAGQGQDYWRSTLDMSRTLDISEPDDQASDDLQAAAAAIAGLDSIYFGLSPTSAQTFGLITPRAAEPTTDAAAERAPSSSASSSSDWLTEEEGQEEGEPEEGEPEEGEPVGETESQQNLSLDDILGGALLTEETVGSLERLDLDRAPVAAAPLSSGLDLSSLVHSVHSANLDELAPPGPHDNRDGADGGDAGNLSLDDILGGALLTTGDNAADDEDLDMNDVLALISSA
jgi:hypothetical protein